MLDVLYRLWQDLCDLIRDIDDFEYQEKSTPKNKQTQADFISGEYLRNKRRSEAFRAYRTSHSRENERAEAVKQMAERKIEGRRSAALCDARLRESKDWQRRSAATYEAPRESIDWQRRRQENQPTMAVA